MQPVVLPYAASRELATELAGLTRHGLQVRVIAPEDRRGLRAALADAAVLWHVLEPVTAALLAEAPRLRLIQKIGVGLDSIDLTAAKARGIAVCSMPGTSTQAVAEMTLALMLACLRRLPTLDQALRAGMGWVLPADEQALYGEIGGRTVGLVGYGAVPARLAPMLRAMGARLLYWNRRPKGDVLAELVPLRELMETSDIVSLHLPLTPETERLIDASALGLIGYVNEPWPTLLTNVGPRCWAAPLLMPCPGCRRGCAGSGMTRCRSRGCARGRSAGRPRLGRAAHWGRPAPTRRRAGYW